MEKIGGPLRELLSRLRLNQPMEGWQAVDLWSEIAGDRVAAHAEAVSYRDGTLFVQVDSAAWMNELTYMRRRFQKEINRRIGSDVVREIRLQPGGRDKRKPDRTGER